MPLTIKVKAGDWFAEHTFVSFWLTPDVAAELNSYCLEGNCNRSAVIREAIEKFLQGVSPSHSKKRLKTGKIRDLLRR